MTTDTSTAKLKRDTRSYATAVRELSTSRVLMSVQARSAVPSTRMCAGARLGKSGPRAKTRRAPASRATWSVRSRRRSSNSHSSTTATPTAEATGRTSAPTGALGGIWYQAGRAILAPVPDRRSAVPNTVLVTREPPIAVVQLNRPEVLNALNEEVLGELLAALADLDDDAEIRCIVLTGNERAFAAGADIKENFVAATPVSMLPQDLPSRWEAIRRVKKPIIAAVSGFALGGGCELAMTCDIIVASETAKFGQPEINLGIIPGAGGTQRLTSAVGKRIANEIILTGRFVGAQEAKAIGLVAHVYPAVSWLQDAKTLARTIADKAPVAARLATEAVDLAWNST